MKKEILNRETTDKIKKYQPGKFNPYICWNLSTFFLNGRR